MTWPLLRKKHPYPKSSLQTGLFGLLLLVFIGGTGTIYSYIGNPGLLDSASDFLLDDQSNVAQLPNLQFLQNRYQTLQAYDDARDHDWAALIMQYAQIGDHERAWAIQNDAQARFHDSLELRLNEARLLRIRDLQETPETTAIMEEVLARDPKNWEAQWFLGIGILQRGGDIEHAKTLIATVLEQLPQDDPK
ncbi:MAG: hypothetical protein AAF352_03760, partial [Pseudomonadota bacterium]